MAKVYAATSLTGGGTGALDGISGASLTDGDVCVTSGGGIYLLDADSALAESSPEVITMDVSPGDKRWILQPNGPINAKWFGAVGDGTTDDTATLQAFINCLEASSGAYGYIPKGIYKHTGLTITKSIKLSGDGGFLSDTGGVSSGTVLKNTHSTNASLTITAYEGLFFGLAIEDMVVLADSTVSGRTGDGIVVNGEGVMDFNRLVVFYHGGNGFNLASASHTNGVNIKNCLIYFNGGSGIYGRTLSTKQLNAINIQNNYIQNNTVAGINIWGNVLNIDHNVIQSNSGPGVMISGEDITAEASVSALVVNVKDNYFEANKGGDILAEISYHAAPARTRSIQYLVIEDNSFSTQASQVNVGVTAVVMFRYNTTYTYYNGFFHSRLGRNRYNTDLYYADFDPLATGTGCTAQYFTIVPQLIDGAVITDHYHAVTSLTAIEETRSRTGAGYPTATPDFRGQTYLDTTNVRMWEAMYGGNTLYWRPITRAMQFSVTAKTTSATLTIAEVLTGLITGTHTAGATQTYTLPTGTLADASGYFMAYDYFDWTLINLSAAAADTITVAGDTGHTVVGNMVVQSQHATTGALYGASATFRTRKTAANTFITYRLN